MLGKRLGDDQDATTRPKRDGCLRSAVGSGGKAAVELMQPRDCNYAVSLRDGIECPWSLLTYNPRLEGYEVNVSEQQLKGAPRYSKNESWDWSDRARGKKVYDYYGVAPDWDA
jgi:hypothetical protein